MKKGLLFLFALAVSLGLLEAALRAIRFPPPLISGWRAIGVSRPLDPRELNDLGYRGQPIRYDESDVVVLLLGDSSVQAEACSFPFLPETRLQFHLRERGIPARVFSLGANGYGQDQQLLALQEYLGQYRADLAVVWMTPDNDVWNNLFPSHWPADGWPKPTFWLEGGHLAGPHEAWGEPVMRSKVFNALYRLANLRDRAWARRLPPAYRPMNAYDGPVDMDWQRRWDEGSFRNENLASEKSHLAIGLTPPSSRMEYGLHLTRLLLGRIEEALRRHGAAPVVVEHQVPDAGESGAETVYELNGRYYRYDRRQIRINMDRITAGFDAHRIPVTTPDPRAAADDPHLNERATDQVMRDLAGILADRLSKPPPGQGSDGQRMGGR
jgi:hypothetical protein